jgi:hypothetical protein
MHFDVKVGIGVTVMEANGKMNRVSVQIVPEK